jgi:Fic family protein
MTYEPSYSITNAITTAIGRIDEAKGFLAATRLSTDWLSQMQHQALVQEAFHTTRIEGAHLTLEQAERLLAGEAVREAPRDDARELLNYRDAFDLVSEHLESGDPVTEGLVREIHKRLVDGVRGNSAAPGEYRRVQDYVVNSSTGDTVYTPPPSYEVPRLMAELVAWLREPSDAHPVLTAGLAQIELVRIHPFLDGNGRTARLLSTLCLYRSGYDFKRLFTISAYYDQNRPAYYAAIRSGNEAGTDLTSWLEYFSTGLAAQMRATAGRASLIMKRDQAVGRLGLNDRQAEILLIALEEGALTIGTLVDKFPGVSRRTLQRDLTAMVAREALTAEGATNRKMYRVAQASL